MGIGAAEGEIDVGVGAGADTLLDSVFRGDFVAGVDAPAL